MPISANSQRAIGSVYALEIFNPTLPDIDFDNPPDYEVKAFDSLPIANINKDTYYGTFRYLKFVDAMYITRTDGRPIWDMWGVFGASDVVDYEARIDLDTSLMDYDKNGAWWQYRISKIKNDDNAYIGLNLFDSQTRETYVKYNPNNTIHDLNQNIGSGSHRNDGVNPGDEEYTWGSFPISYVRNENDRAYFYFYGNVYYETDALGGIYEEKFLEKHLSTEFYVSPRNWENELVIESDNVVEDLYNGSPIYFSNKEFVAKSTNLNNYIKVNNQLIDLATSELIASHQSGHKYTVNEGNVTKFEIENGSENTFETYYVAIDNTLPDVVLNYPNSENNSNYSETPVVTDERGLKHQTINLGVIRDYIEIDFDTLQDETNETASYSFNGVSQSYLSGQNLSDGGSYSVVITDALGHSKTINFAVDMQSLEHNYNRLVNNNYKITKWYNAVIPNNYTGKGTYSFANYEDALSFAITQENENQVTTYNLQNLSEFTHYNLVAEENVVKVGEYYYYKSRSDPELYVYYFDIESLNETIEYYASDYITTAQYYKSNSVVNNYYTLDDSMYSNLWNEAVQEAYLVNNFVFENLDNDINSKIYYDYIDDEQGYVEFNYGTLFESQVTSSGLYKIKEVDQVGHITEYYVYLDLQAPSIDISLKLFEQDAIDVNISVNDLPINNELIYYAENFSLQSVVEADAWWTMEVVRNNEQKYYYTCLDELPALEELGNGEYDIKIYDRIDNQFEFKVFISNIAPVASFENSTEGDSFNLIVSNKESFNDIVSLSIYKNQTLLNSEDGYDEFPYDEDDEIIKISSQVLEYVFNASGDYEIEIVDRFGRTLTYEHSFRRSFIMNTSSIGLIAGAIAIGVVLLLGTVIGARSYIYKFK